MKNFSELLTEYMRRTGISDSELARTLGVRRQTIFRWKEGLTERPRRREDVLLCAQKLRLSSPECNELLLAAGFSPETAVAIPTAPETPVSLPIPSAPEAISEPLIQPTHPRKSARWIPVAIVLLFGLLVLGIFFFRSQTPPYPIAVEGETLVIIAFLDSPIQSATPTPNPRGANERNDIGSRLEAALEREVVAAHMERVRVAMLGASYPVRDTRSALDLRGRTRAAIVVWGAIENGFMEANLVPVSRQDAAASLDALIIAPNEMSMKISPDEIQTLALVVLAQLQLASGEDDLARASLTQALSRPLGDKVSLATVYAFLGYTAQIAQPPDLDLALQSASASLDLAPDAFAPHLNRGVAYVRRDDPMRWQLDLNRAVQLREKDVLANRALCWAYALDKDGSRALPFCEAAVQNDPTPQSREARALAYADLGQLNDATGDLQIFVNWMGLQPVSVRSRYGTSRSEWLESLKQNKNPFDDAVLYRLRRE